MPPQHSVSVPQRRSLDTVSTWALLITIVAALFVITPFASIPSVTTKTFLLAAGALITLALYILARLTRGNVIFPPAVLLGALWLPVIAYAASSAFSGVSFANAFWGSSLEPDTLGLMLIAASLGTPSALVLRRPEHDNAFLKIGAGTVVVATLAEVIIVIVGQFAPNTISPAFSLVGSFTDMASLMGLGVVMILITLRFLELETPTYRILIGSGVVALFLLAIANSS